MRKGWSQTGANGKPLKTGQIAYFIDHEDGTRPIFTYGYSMEEVLEKLALTAGTAQERLEQERKTASAPRAAAGETRPAPPAPRRLTLTPEQQMTTVNDLTDPAKAPAAIASLLESETGVDFRKLQEQRFSEIAWAWQQRHPEFYDHNANVRLLTENAITRARGLKNVTEQHFEDAYNELRAGDFFVRKDEMNPDHIDQPAENGNTPEARPNGHSATTARRTPAPGVSQATTYRSSSLNAQPSAGNLPPTLKYTRDQIERMPSAEMRRLIDSNDPHFAKAFDYYESHPREADHA